MITSNDQNGEKETEKRSAISETKFVISVQEIHTRITEGENEQKMDEDPGCLHCKRAVSFSSFYKSTILEGHRSLEPHLTALLMLLLLSLFVFFQVYLGG